MKIRAVLAFVCLSGILGGCGGGSGVPSGAASNAVLPIVANHPPLRDGRKGSVRVSIRIPRDKHRRGPRYVSPATAGASLAFTGAESFTVAVGLTQSSNPNGCSTIRGATTCSITIALAHGTYTATISTYDRAPVSGSIPHGAHLLSTAANVPLTVEAGKHNNANFALTGVPAALSISGLPSATIGTEFSAPQAFTVTAKDADGYVIVGPYSNAITLSTGDATNAAIATAGYDSPSAGELLSSADSATLDYTGAPITSATIGAAATGAASGSATFAPVPVLSSIGVTSSNGAVSVGIQQTLFLTGHFATGPGNNPMSIVTVSGASLTNVNVASATQMSATIYLDPVNVSAGSIAVAVQTSAGTASSPVGLTVSTAGIDVVSDATDSNAGTPPGTGTGDGHDLRSMMLTAKAGDTIVFSTQAMCGASQCTITLAGPLPPIEQDLTIDGGQYSGGTPSVIIDGSSAYSAFFVDTGTVTITHLEIANTLAQGGLGSSDVNFNSSGGGGGAALGAGLFVNQSGANVSVTNDYFLNNHAKGGKGGVGSAFYFGAGGGGGLNGGGGGVGYGGGGGGGGGVLAYGATSNIEAGAAGGLGGGGGGGPYCGAPKPGGLGGAAYGSNSAGGNADGTGSGAAGGFGGGGGGSGGNCTVSQLGGAGGFGGGGGGAYAAYGGNGGTGGGGGAGPHGGGIGGALSANVSGGNGDGSGNGGGGAAAGPAIFVNAGTLRTLNSGASNATAAGGGAGGGSATAGGADNTPVFNYGGTVNSVSVSPGGGGPVAGALGSSPPQLRRAPQHATASVPFARSCGDRNRDTRSCR